MLVRAIELRLLQPPHRPIANEFNPIRASQINLKLIKRLEDSLPDRRRGIRQIVVLDRLAELERSRVGTEDDDVPKVGVGRTILEGAAVGEGGEEGREDEVRRARFDVAGEIDGDDAGGGENGFDGRPGFEGEER